MGDDCPHEKVTNVNRRDDDGFYEFGQKCTDCGTMVEDWHR